MTDSLLQTALLLAENGGQQTTPLSMLLPLAAIAFVFYLMIFRPQRREQKARQDMLATLKKNDRVVTTGGIYGVVANVRPEADEVTIKVDEATNTKLKVTLSSIARVTRDDTPEPKPAT